MSYGGFGGHSGPTVPPKNVTFGQGSRPPSVSPPQPLQPRPQAPAFPRPASFPRPAPVRSPPMPRPEGVGNFSASGAPFSGQAAQRPSVSFPNVVEGQKPLYEDNIPRVNQRSSHATSLIASRTSGGVSANIVRSSDPRRSNLPQQSMQRGTMSNVAKQSQPPLSYEDIYDSGQSYVPSTEARGQSGPRPTQPISSSPMNNYSSPEFPHSREVQRKFAPQSRPPLSYEDIYDSEQTFVSSTEVARVSGPWPARTISSDTRKNYSTMQIPRYGEAQQHASIPTTWSSRSKSPGSYNNPMARKDPSQSPPYSSPYDSQRSPVSATLDVGTPVKIKSPLLPTTDGVLSQSAQLEKFEPKRTSPQLPLTNTRRDIIVRHPQLSIYQNVPSSFSNIFTEATANKSESLAAVKRTRPSSPVPADDDLQNLRNTTPFLGSTNESPLTKPSSSPLSKRIRSPSSFSSNQELQQPSHSSLENTEREEQAKAKRMARFKVELIESPENSSEFLDSKSSMKHDSTMVERVKLSKITAMDESEEYPSNDHDGSEPAGIITGLCQDMCPESERSERERKGDLDQYERVDGDRNQTSEFLAVKKYTRTAEREAILIRPMPVLQRTMEYLLGLLDQPYDDRFLGTYNFLWDRMRAVRMDLRMQHIFNLDSVKMLEQMIRLHIIAMHELCEYEKGEGFSEGFDAHLNIEQMNKASAELFQLYDDHRRKGIDVPTEKEFRGYYALLKLDRHPGYKVEPAELSLDLAKMTPEIRQSSEIRFSRDVARACRTGNFISFFRLARKSSYLQACLMHAHFAKLRSQALASLHSGLQSNQGLPVSVAAGWLAMEEEDIENVLQYHGFVLKEFEEPYMVKEGPFLHSDRDYPTKRSNLVHLKKSSRIVDDVLSSQSVSLPFKKGKKVQLDRNFSLKTVAPVQQLSQMEEDEKLDDFRASPSSEQKNQEHKPLKLPSVSRVEGSSQTIASSANLSWNFSVALASPKVPPVSFGETFKFTVNSSPLNFPVTPTSPKAPLLNLPNVSINSSRGEMSIPSAMDVMPSPVVPAVFSQELSHHASNSAFEKSLDRVESISRLEIEAAPETYHQEGELDLDMSQENPPEEFDDEEVKEAKLKLILRSWKRRSSKRRELRERRHILAADALNTLTLGPPIQWNKHHGTDIATFDIDLIARERYRKQEQSLSLLNVSDVAVSTLTRRNPEANCLCWKIIVCSPMVGTDIEMGDQTKQEANTASALNWLLAKLMPHKDNDDDELAISYPGLSIWKKWVMPQSRSDLTCCLSVIKDITYDDDQNESVHGASAILFLLSEDTPLDLQKVRLRNLLDSLPTGSGLPLLILSDSTTKEDPSAIISSVGVHEVDQSKVGSSTVVFLTGDEQTEALDGFYSDRRLREGLQWLASVSPPQPILLSLQTRTLIQCHLSSSLEVLARLGFALDLNQYVAAFNDAVDQSINKVTAAANMNPSGWPCPEIHLLRDFSNEQLFVGQYLPTTEWSSDPKIRSLLSALRDCKLPKFDEDSSWLKRGCYGGEEIERQKLLLEDFLIRYLTDSTNIMGLPLARSEASAMVQRNVRLELRDSAYFFIPMWESICRRIFNWRLMSLSEEEKLTTCYILKQDAVHLRAPNMSTSVSEESMLPFLDEVLRVGVLKSSAELDRRPEVLEPIKSNFDTAIQQQKYHTETDGPLCNGEMVSRSDDCGDYTSHQSKSSGSIGFDLTVANEQTENLSRLLEQCNILQNGIEQKLSVYFC